MVAVGFRSSRVGHGELKSIKRLKKSSLALRLEILKRCVLSHQVKMANDGAHEEAEVSGFLLARNLLQ